MDGHIIIYNEPENNEYQVLSDIPETNNQHTSNAGQYATISIDHSENVNLCANTWMTQAAIKELEQLFNEWKFESLLPIFLDECIDVPALKLITNHHLGKIAKKWNIKMGVIIKFEKCLISWQKSNNGCSSTTFDAVIENYEINNNYNKDDNQPSSSKTATTTALNILKIIESSSQGRAVLDYHKTNSKLNEGSRVVIVDLIINYMVQNDIRMTVKIVQRIAEDIVKLFDTEVMDYYYLKQAGKKPQGKLYDKYFNVIRKLKDNGVLEKRPYINKASMGDHKRIIHLDPPEVNIENSIEAILGDNCTWAEIESHWLATKNYRLNEIASSKLTSDVLNKWTQYKKPLGFKLVDMDFQHLYPNAECFRTKYEAFASKIVSVLDDRIKDPASKIILKNFKAKENISENGRCCTIFYLIHSVLVPSTKIFNFNNGKKMCTRFSIRDSQKSFVMEGSTVAACEEALLKLYEAKTPIQPLILISGSILEPKEIVIYFEGVKYRMHSALNAIDICFKIFFVFNLEYPKESSLVWTFIQKYFYSISTNCDCDSPQINILISNLNNI